jgi:ankyrin repeat protein
VACLASYLDDGVDVDLADSTRRSLLFHAVNYGQIAAVQLLLDR